MNRTGIVVEADPAGGTARVNLEGHGSCDKCGMCMGSDNHKGTVIEVRNTLHAKPGDAVELTLTTQEGLRAALIVYLIPLILMIAGIACGPLLAGKDGNGEAYGAVLALLGIGLGFVVVHILDRIMKKGSAISITKIMGY